MSASISSWWWWLKLACVSTFWPFWPNNSFVTRYEKCCYFEAEICEGEVICLFAHNWHFIFRSSTVLVQIFRLQTDNWFFLFSLLSSHLLTRSICIQSHREAKSHFLGFLEHLWLGTICQCGPLMGLFTSLQMFHWPISGYMDYCLNSLRCFIGSQTSQHLYVYHF